MLAWVFGWSGRDGEKRWGGVRRVLGGFCEQTGERAEDHGVSSVKVTDLYNLQREREGPKADVGDRVQRSADVGDRVQRSADVGDRVQRSADVGDRVERTADLYNLQREREGPKAE